MYLASVEKAALLVWLAVRNEIGSHHMKRVNAASGERITEGLVLSCRV